MEKCFIDTKVMPKWILLSAPWWLLKWHGYYPCPWLLSEVAPQKLLSNAEIFAGSLCGTERSAFAMIKALKLTTLASTLAVGHEWKKMRPKCAWLQGQLKVCDPMGQVIREAGVGERKPHEGKRILFVWFTALSLILSLMPSPWSLWIEHELSEVCVMVQYLLHSFP